MEELQLHDIKGLVEIPDDSIYYFYGLIFIATVALIVIAILLYKYLKKEKVINLQQLYKDELNQVDLTQTKDAAYKISHYGHLLHKNENQQAAFELLHLELEKFKYKKEVPAFDEALRGQISNFMDLMNA